jgi:dTDP-4-dehydrorhamnose 3,5-epimerase-like enzyme
MSSFSRLIVDVAPEFEFEIQPTDLELNIDWRVDSILDSSFILSPKDLKAPTLAERLAEGKLPK